MNCEQHHDCDGVECQGSDACAICGVWAPCDCDALRAAGAEECERLWLVNGTEVSR